MLGHTISQQRIDSNAIANAPPLNQVVNSNDPYLPVNNEKYASLEENSVKSVADDPVSTFSVDVDTGSYTNVRRMLQQGYLPQPDAVRVEEFINYFDYSYAAPKSTKDPFSVTTELAPTPWNANSSLLKIGLQAYEVDASERPSANLVFLMDVSGSMNSPDKLPLLKKSFRMLTKHLNEDDSVSIVVYAGASGVVLEPTNGDNKREILAAMSRLRAGGSTNGVAGIQLAYQMAEQAYIDGGINRIILATDGDFNVGTSNVEALKRLIEDKRKTGISLTTLGFGTGNYNDQLMEQIADVGNGNNAYIDSVQEAEKVLVTEMSSTLLTVAKDVKIQIEFNPMQVSEYRLIGYENRALKREDFNNDTVDAGEIGAGHNVTAIYEIFPSEQQSRAIDPLRYGKQQSNNHSSKIQAPMSYRNEIAYVKLRFKYPDADKSQLRKFVVKKSDERRLRSTSPEFRFAAAVSAFGQKLKRSQYIKDFGYEDIYELAQSGAQNDEHGYRHEFVGLVELAAELSGENGDHLLSETH
ncbi:MAG: VWA domain-containing protein [Gammaproteobacteria bacterium]|nr:VWA domain-containing protein [Gammaproteobacteria bacterium]